MLPFFFQSTYKSNLEGYTTQLATDKNSEEYRKMEADAARLANEIEGSGTNKLAIELENGDEEEAFSAVVRSKGEFSFLTAFFFSFNYYCLPKIDALVPLLRDSQK